MSENKLVLGKCPKCGGDVVKTLKGYRCLNAMGDNATCDFDIFGVVANKKISDNDVRELLESKAVILDGCSTKDQKIFSTIWLINENGVTELNSKMCKCPRCGGDIFIGTKGFNCSNFADNANPCRFVIWRNMSGHDITLSEVLEICQKGATDQPVEMYGPDGEIFSKRLALSPEKDKVVKI